jgi:hypothetical protein
VGISDPATAHFTAIKNLGNTRIAYKSRHTHTHTHLETLEARKTQVAISDTATHRPQHARGPKYQYKIHTNTQWHTNTIAYRNNVGVVISINDCVCVPIRSITRMLAIQKAEPGKESNDLTGKPPMANGQP